MGARAQVHIEENGVYLYTHWGASGLITDVAQALKKKWRWNDPDYLTRIIFDYMVGDEWGTETGFGIGTQENGDNEYIIHIKAGNKVQIIGDHAWEGTFEEFIREYGG